MHHRQVQLPEDHGGRFEFVRGRLMSALSGNPDLLGDFAMAIRPWITAIRLEREAFFLGSEAEIATRSQAVDAEHASILEHWHGKIKPERMRDLARLVADFTRQDAGDELLQILCEISHKGTVTPKTCPTPQAS